MFATHNQNLRMAKMIVEGGASVLKPIDKGVTMFHLAAANNDVRLLDFAISQREHSNVDFRTDEGWTPV